MKRRTLFDFAFKAVKQPKQVSSSDSGASVSTEVPTEMPPDDAETDSSLSRANDSGCSRSADESIAKNKAHDSSLSRPSDSGCSMTNDILDQICITA